MAGRDHNITARDILGEAGLADHDQHWKLTSSMQGLGDSSTLLEVNPGSCRFGPLRRGHIYSMSFTIRNLDVDVTRFNVFCDPGGCVKVRYQTGPIAPGMSAKIFVEVVAKEAKRVEQLVEVRVKAHTVRVPVMAKIHEAHQYDRLDEDSLRLNGRHIGKHRAGADGGKGPIEVILDDAYARKELGQAYLPVPDNFLDESA
jgi:hypothetical protein